MGKFDFETRSMSIEEISKTIASHRRKGLNHTIQYIHQEFRIDGKLVLIANKATNLRDDIVYNNIKDIKSKKAAEDEAAIKAAAEKGETVTCKTRKATSFIHLDSDPNYIMTDRTKLENKFVFFYPTKKSRDHEEIFVDGIKFEENENPELATKINAKKTPISKKGKVFILPITKILEIN